MSRMGRAARFFAAGFDTAAIGVLAWSETGGRFAATFSEYILWGSVLAAAICALVILRGSGSATSFSAVSSRRAALTTVSSCSPWRSRRWSRGRAVR